MKNKVLIKKIGEIENLIQGLNIEEKYVGYTISFKRENSKLIVTLSLSKSWMEKKKFIPPARQHINVTLDDNIKLSFLSFASWSKPVYIKNLVVV